jgi:DTW domain-containing protein YfiP
MSRARCERCLRPEYHCLCSLIPVLDSRTRVLILQHPSEVDHALNTARFAALGLTNAQLLVGEVFENLDPLLHIPGYQTRLLFPGETATPLSVQDAANAPVLLVVPDGTWRKARKLLHLNPQLAALPRVTLQNAPASRYRLRKAPGPDALSTLEAVVHALHTLEPAHSFAALLQPFDALIEGQIAAMGQQTFRRNHA